MSQKYIRGGVAVIGVLSAVAGALVVAPVTAFAGEDTWQAAHAVHADRRAAHVENRRIAVDRARVRYDVATGHYLAAAHAHANLRQAAHVRNRDARLAHGQRHVLNYDLHH